ncbi:MAG: hypothetical protein ACREUU_20575 [Gammaproteobacteria bacterium]
MRPECVPQLANYPTVRRFVLSHLAMQFGDVRAMLRLPTGDGETRIENGCNFAAAATICNLISGISVVFFNRTGRPAGPRQRPRDRGQRFRDLLNANYYPWHPGEDRGAKIDALYDLARNPLAHALGVLEPGQVPVSCEKTPEGLTQAQVNALDVAYDGQSLPPALEMGGGVWHLNVPYFYAAIVEMFRALVCDPLQMQQTEACFARGELTD